MTDYTREELAETVDESAADKEAWAEQFRASNPPMLSWAAEGDVQATKLRAAAALIRRGGSIENAGRLFADHYAPGINPWLDAAHASMRAALAPPKEPSDD